MPTWTTIILFWTIASAPPQETPRDLVLQLHINDQPITPVTSRYIRRGLEEAHELGARAVILRLDTPGGLVESTQDIVKNIIASRIPVIVYVSPPGARAASAGVFITLAAHVAAMAPATHIGAAHPVNISGPGAPADTTGEQGAGSAMEEKMVNDAVAWSKSLAELRGRNVEWAELAVSESQSITGTEALDLRVIDIIAGNLDTLLTRIDGWEVALETGPVQLRTADAEVRALDMWWGELVLGVISNPNIAFLLMMFGFYGVLFEFYTAGWGIGGTLGAICLVLGFFGMAVLPINYAGLALIILGLGLFVAEAFVVSFGLLTVGGAACLILGGLMLVDSPIDDISVSPSIVIPVALATAAITFFLVSRIVAAQRTQTQTGSETLLKAVAVSVQDFDAVDEVFKGHVRVQGALWTAICRERVGESESVVIERREGLTLYVRRRTPPNIPVTLPKERPS